MLQMLSPRAAEPCDRLSAAGAWLDAALRSIARELPGWQLRRLIFDEGEWHCALSTARDMPDWLDEAVESHDPDLAAAVLAACQAARERAVAPIAPLPCRTSDTELMCCENYA